MVHGIEIDSRPVFEIERPIENALPFTILPVKPNDFVDSR